MFSQKIAFVFQSKSFKKVTLVLGVIFMILTGLISINPEPMLKFGYLGVFVFNLFGAGTLLVFSLARHMNVFGLAAATSLGMSFNDSVAWLIGNSGQAIVPRSPKTQKVERVIQKYGAFGLFIWALLPIPYDIIGLVAGYLGLSYKQYFLPSFFGKFLRMVLIGLGVVTFISK